MNHSITTEEVGFKTYIISMKNPDAKVNNMDILKFIKNNFQNHKVTNVHVQSSNVIFDIPDANLPDFKN